MAGIHHRLDAEEKLDILAESARYDVCLSTCSGNSGGGVGRLRDPADPLSRWIYPSYVPGKGRVGILKILQANSCTNHCKYCVFSASRDCLRRTRLNPEELADIFMGFYRAHLVHGIFISSGIDGSPDSAMNEMIKTAVLLRRKHSFHDYIHLKILPGCSEVMIEEAAKVANRVSINLELPTPELLGTLAPEKEFKKDLLTRMGWAAKYVQRRIGASSHTTQFVVGAGGESDLDVLQTVDWIYSDYHVFRSYFSAYQSFTQRRMGPQRDDSLLREHRLYQCDFLLRGYGFRLRDMVFDAQNRLPMTVDPKTAHAMMHPELFPVDINHDDENRLLRVPGIGRVSADRIIKRRLGRKYRSLDELKESGAWIRHAAPYVIFSGKRDRRCRDAGQGWLFEQDPPPGWNTGYTPASGAPDTGYVYPGQTGKRLYYALGKSTDTVRCR